MRKKWSQWEAWIHEGVTPLSCKRRMEMVNREAGEDNRIARTNKEATKRQCNSKDQRGGRRPTNE